MRQGAGASNPFIPAALLGYDSKKLPAHAKRKLGWMPNPKKRATPKLPSGEKPYRKGQP